ncbi:MAG: hypothetical protein JSR26_05735 [Proteobacteria bacterium]|nr:hypothetical protein [Pseudomonadota bacterium]
MRIFHGNKILLSFTLGLAVFALPVAAAAGTLPVYPDAVNKTPDMPAGGALSQLETADSVDKVDAWFASRLPKSCAHMAAQGGAKYTCGNRVIVISPNKGKTLISYLTMMGGLPGQ